MSTSKESRVPSSRLSRLANFGYLAFGLGRGAAAEVTRRAFNNVFFKNNILNYFFRIKNYPNRIHF